MDVRATHAAAWYKKQHARFSEISFVYRYRYQRPKFYEDYGAKMKVHLGLGILLIVIASCTARDIPTRAGIYMYFII